MAVIQRRSIATAPLSTIVVLAVVVIIAAIVITIQWRKRRGPVRRSPNPAVNRFTIQSMLPKPPESPRSSQPSRETHYPPMRSELQNNPHRNHGRPVPLTASSTGPVRGSATRGSTRTTQPLPGTSSMVTMFKVPSSDPVRPLPPTPSKTPPVRKAIPVRSNDVLYLPQNAYSIPSSTATAVGTRTASNTPSPPRQQLHSANRPPTSAGTLRDTTTSSSTLQNTISSSTVQAPVSTYNSQTRTLRSPLSDRNIQVPAQAHQDHPALRQPVSSPSLPSKKTNDLPSTLLQPLPFPLTSDTTDLSTELANPHEQAHLGYKNPSTSTTVRQGPGHQPNIQTTTTTNTPTHAQSQQSNTKPSSSRPHVNSTYANYLSTCLQTPTSSSSLLNSSSLAALLVGSEAGTTDAGSGYDAVGPPITENDGKPTYRASIEGGGGGGTTTAGPAFGNIRTGRGRERSGEVEVQERYKRFREKGDFSAGVDDDPVGRPWGRFDSSDIGKERERERDGEVGRERGEEGGGGGGGVMPLRLPIKNPDPNRVVRGAGAG